MTFIDGYYSCITISIMTSIVYYFGYILSSIERKLMNLFEEEPLLPTSVRVKSTDFNMGCDLHDIESGTYIMNIIHDKEGME